MDTNFQLRAYQQDTKEIAIVIYAFPFLSNLVESSGDDKRSDVNRLVDSDSSGSGDFGSGSGGSGGAELPQKPIQAGGRKLGNKLGRKPDKKPGKKPKKGRNTSN